ncbi:MMPL family transporter [Bizionia saleffrena]|uniref:MMPL family transporter n=2 Tax=Bizionia saleffrena TaxID=291189 RepID=A0A8H2LDY7_9FLAO|nr:MMPL family transporter [Bizionia saleffrena]
MFMDNIFISLCHFFNKKKVLFAIIIAVFSLVLMAVASQITFEEDISKLIPENSENKQLQKVLQTAHFSDKIVVIVNRKDNGTLNDLTQYAEAFIDSVNLNLSEYTKAIQGQVGDDTIFETLNFVYENAPLFLTDSDYKILENRRQKDSILKRTEANYKTLISPSGLIAKQTIVKDPLGISLLAVKHLQKLGIHKDFQLKNGFIVSKNESHLLLFITPQYGSSETNKNVAFANGLYNIQDELNISFSDTVSSEYFGGTLIAVANAQQIKKDIQLTISIALTVLMILFIVFYKKLSIPLILFTPTLFGGLLSVAILFLIRETISAISLGIGAILLGVTLDYSLHILTHIRNKEDTTALYKSVTKPILMSSLTTALAFLCLLFIDSQALQDLGIFAAISVLGASVFALIFIPQVYTVKNNASAHRKTFIDAVASYPFHRNTFIIGAVILLCITSLFTYNNVQFNQDISKLNYMPPAIKNAENRLEKLTNAASKSLYIVTYSDTLQVALEANDNIVKRLTTLEQQQQISSFNSVGALVYSEKKQREKINQWQAFWSPEHVGFTKQQLITSGTQFGFKPETFNAFYQLLEKSFTPLELNDYRTLNTISIDDFIASENGFNAVSSLVTLEDNQVARLKTSFKNTPNTLVIDRQAINETLLGNLKNDFNQLIIYSFAVVVVLLLLFYRNVKLTLVTCIPIMLTWCITIGIMGLFSIEFNIFNIIISTFIFGLGIDYSIFITNGLLQEQKTGINTLPMYKTSVILSVITTIFGVGVLVFAKHPALYSISIVTIIGITSALVVAFTIQPILFNVFILKKRSLN